MSDHKHILASPGNGKVYCLVCSKQLTAHDFEDEGKQPEKCFYHAECKGDGKHQCPVCKQWYCDECHEMFLPIDPKFWVETAMMCPQCHYSRYELPKFNRGER